MKKIFNSIMSIFGTLMGLLIGITTAIALIKVCIFLIKWKV